MADNSSGSREGKPTPQQQNPLRMNPPFAPITRQQRVGTNLRRDRPQLPPGAQKEWNAFLDQIGDEEDENGDSRNSPTQAEVVFSPPPATEPNPDPNEGIDFDGRHNRYNTPYPRGADSRHATPYPRGAQTSSPPGRRLDEIRDEGVNRDPRYSLTQVGELLPPPSARRPYSPSQDIDLYGMHRDTRHGGLSHRHVTISSHSRRPTGSRHHTESSRHLTGAQTFTVYPTPRRSHSFGSTTTAAESNPPGTKEKERKPILGEGVKRTLTQIKRAATLVRRATIGQKDPAEKEAERQQRQKMAEIERYTAEELRALALSERLDQDFLYDLARREGVYLPPRRRRFDHDQYDLADGLVARLSGRGDDGEYIFLGSQKRLYIGTHDLGRGARPISNDEEKRHYSHYRWVAQAYYQLCMF
ncbi:hypothetical protein F4777DRAFT_207500 [Nemania sp. FL0916]|nr:hypothetical protein F4777DRAFT_207500 [Nemania sp. FL0916]